MNKLLSLFIRYIFVALLSLNGLVLFYFILTPLTSKVVFTMLDIFYNISYISETSILIANYSIIHLIPACIAGAAYFLLLALNFSVPLETKKRIESLIFLLGGFFIINVARIIIFAFLYLSGFKYFDLAHELSWNFLSTLLIVLIWFTNVRIFNIDSLPIYSDFKYILRSMKDDS